MKLGVANPAHLGNQLKFTKTIRRATLAPKQVSLFLSLIILWGMLREIRVSSIREQGHPLNEFKGLFAFFPSCSLHPRFGFKSVRLNLVEFSYSNVHLTEKQYSTFTNNKLLLRI